jgi:hypothetical protein
VDRRRAALAAAAGARAAARREAEVRVAAAFAVSDGSAAKQAGGPAGSTVAPTGRCGMGALLANVEIGILLFYRKKRKAPKQSGLTR